MENHKEKPLGSDVLAGDLRKGWDSTDRLPDRIEGYSKLKKRTEQFTDWAIDSGIAASTFKNRKLFRKIDSCGGYLMFRFYTVSNVSRMIGMCSCKEHLICAFCASRRGVKNSVAYKEKLLEIQKEHPETKLLFITFTVKNGPDLFERFQHLRSSMQSLVRRRNDSIRRGTSSSFKDVLGGVFSYEFKRGSGSDEWHPHTHGLYLVPKNYFLNIQAVKDEWQHITGDSAVVNVKEVKDDAAFLEVFAYALKFSEMSHPDRWNAFNILKGDRLISSFGVFRGVEVPESLDDELLDSDEPWLDMLFKYQKRRGYDQGTFIDAHPDYNLGKSDLEAA